MFGAGDYAMRIWLDPAKLAARSLTTGEVIAAIREQNAQVAAGTVGASPAPAGTEFQLAVNTQGRLANEEEFADIIVRTDPSTGGLIRIRDLGRVELSSGTYSLRSLLNNKEAAAIAIFQAPGSNALALSNAVRAKMEQLKPDFPQGMGYSIVYDPTRFVQTSILEVIETLVHRRAAGRDRRHHLPADLARLDHPAARRAGVDRRHVRVPAPARLLDQHADAVRPGARDRHRRRRRDRRGRERRAPHRRGHERARRDGQGDAGGLGADRRDRAGPLRGVHSARLRPRPDRPVLQAVRGDDRDQHGDLGVQLAHPLAGAERVAAQAARRAAGLADARHGPRLRPVLPLVQRLVRAQERRLRPRCHADPAAQVDRDDRLRGAARADGAALHAHSLGVRPGAGQAIPDRHRPAARRGIARPHRCRDPAHERHRPEDARDHRRGRVPGPVDRGLLGGAERRDHLLRPEAVRGAHLARAVEVRDPRQGQRRAAADPGRAHVRRAAARGRRPRQRRRLQAPGPGPRGPRRAGALRRRLGNARPGLRQPEVEHRHAVLDLRHQRAATVRQRRPRPRQADGRQARRHLRHDAGQPRLALRQRLHQVRQDLPGDRPGGRAVSRRRAGDRPAEDEERRRRHGAARAR